MYYQTKLRLLFNSTAALEKYNQHLEILAIFLKEQGVRDKIIKPKNLPDFVNFEFWISANERLYRSYVSTIDKDTLTVIPSSGKELVGKQGGLLVLGGESYTCAFDIVGSKSLELEIKTQEYLVQLAAVRCGVPEKVAKPVRTIVYNSADRYIK